MQSAYRQLVRTVYFPSIKTKRGGGLDSWGFAKRHIVAFSFSFTLLVSFEKNLQWYLTVKSTHTKGIGRPYLHIPSSGSSRPNRSSKVSWILVLPGATSLQTTVVLLGYVCGKPGLWSIPSPVTVMIFSWWESWTPVVRQTQTRRHTRIFFFSFLMPKLILNGYNENHLDLHLGGDAEGGMKYSSDPGSRNQEQEVAKLFICF